MRLAVSNIAWTEDDERAVSDVLDRAEVDALEVAPTRLFADPTRVPSREADAVARRMRAQGREIVAFQSLLFTAPEASMFGDRVGRQHFRDHLAAIIDLASVMRVGRLVLGSPRNRRVPAGMTAATASDIAAEVLGDLAHRARCGGVVLCIEPNPEAYGCNFVTTPDQGAALVSAVASPGFALHVDVAGTVLAGADPAAAVLDHSTVIQHVHLSAPELRELETEIVDHEAFAAALAAVGYDGIISIEMRPGGVGTNAERVARALSLARRTYFRDAA